MAKKKTTTRTQKLVTHEDDPFLSVTEVARQLGKSPQTIGRWINDGLLNGVRRPNGIVAVRQSEVNQFLGGSALAGTEVIGDPNSAANIGRR